jgi:hypothetical protein
MFVTVCDSTMYKLVPGSTDNSDVFVSWIEHPEKNNVSTSILPSLPNNFNWCRRTSFYASKDQNVEKGHKYNRFSFSESYEEVALESV